MASTRITELLGTTVPIIAAPLGLGTTPAFLGAIAAAGAIGFVGLTHPSPDEIGPRVSAVSETTGGRFGVNFSLIADKRENLRRALDAGARIVSLWQDDPAPYARIAKDAGALVLWTVSGPEEAARASDLGVDVVVAQGSEAGGHLVGLTPSLVNIPAVVDAARGVPVAAAGGIADGRGLAAALALGAEAVWLGTRFVASRECALHDGYKARIVEADPGDAVETTLYDVGWPDSPHRVLRNDLIEAWERAGRPASGARAGEGEVVGRQADGTAVPRYHIQSPAVGFEGAFEEAWSEMALYAGQSAGLVRDVPGVAEIVERLMREAGEAAGAAARILR